MNSPIDQKASRIDKMLENNMVDEALDALEEFAKEYEEEKLIHVKNQKGEYAKLQDDILKFGDNEQFQFRAKQMRFVLLELNEAIRRNALGETSKVILDRQQGPVNIFIARAMEDEDAFVNLRKNLILLARMNKAKITDQQKVEGFGERDAILKEAIGKSEVVLLVMSPSFLFNDECWDLQVQALQLSKKKGTIVIPILWSDCDFLALELARLQPLPRNRTFIKNWENLDMAMTEISKEISALVEHLRS